MSCFTDSPEQQEKRERINGTTTIWCYRSDPEEIFLYRPTHRNSILGLDRSPGSGLWSWDGDTWDRWDSPRSYGMEHFSGGCERIGEL
jgi:hypothetical protein